MKENSSSLKTLRGRRDGLMVSALVSDLSGFEPWPGTLCCVLGLDT